VSGFRRFDKKYFNLKKSLDVHCLSRKMMALRSFETSGHGITSQKSLIPTNCTVLTSNFACNKQLLEEAVSRVFAERNAQSISALQAVTVLPQLSQ
jgi:hypothetical protein